MTLAARRRMAPASLLMMLALLATGCASSGPTPPSKSQTDSGTSDLSMYVAGHDGLAIFSVRRDTSQVIKPNVGFGGLYLPRSQNRGAVLTLETPSSKKLVLLSVDGSFRTVFETGDKGRFTVAWSPEGTLAFGFDGPREKGIRVLTADGDLRDVGCSVSSRALGWAGRDRLVVGNADNNYVVAISDCSTISRVDARKMHEMAFNPVHPTVGYILRELEYDRKARQYVPDSSLYVARVNGSNPRLVVGDRYKPRRPAWSPDGSELAFDARTPDRPERRLISIYDAESSTSAFLNPSAVSAQISEWDAHWSPGGGSIAYMQRSGKNGPAVVVRPIHGSFVVAVGESGERFARWIDDAYLVVTDGKHERIVSADGNTSAQGPEGGTILAMK